MNIDNGKQLQLHIDGVFEGMAGQSGNKLAFIPNKTVRPPESATRGVLDGQTVSLAVERQGRTDLYVATFSPLI